MTTCCWKNVSALERPGEGRKCQAPFLPCIVGDFVAAANSILPVMATQRPVGKFRHFRQQVFAWFTGNDVQKTRAILSQVTRQGRALGVHAILATQRPDARALDTQVKANLSGIICYQLPNDASSIIVLGNGRATDITNNRGRAILKRGPDLIEMQTPILNKDEINTLLTDYRIDSNSQKKKTNDSSKGEKGSKK